MNKKIFISTIIFIIFLILTLLIYILFFFKEIFFTLIFFFILYKLNKKIIFLFKQLYLKYFTKLLLIFFLFYYVYIIIKYKIFFFQLLNLRSIEHILFQSIGLFQDFFKLIPKYIVNYIYIFNINSFIFSNFKEKVRKIIYILYCFISIFFIINNIRIKKEIINNKYYQKNNILKEYINNLIKKIFFDLKNFFIAKLIESMFIFLFSSIGYYLFDLKGWFFLGLYMGLLNNIPFLGPIFGTILPVLVSLTNSIYKSINILFVCILVQLIDNIYLIPFIVSDKIKVNPIISIIMVLTCSQIFGSIGMIFALPILLIYKSIIKETYYFLNRIYYKK